MNKNKGNEASLRGGNNKRQPQKHQNKQKFKPMFNDKLINLQKNAPMDFLCQRCVEQIQWKLQMSKYKVIKDPHTCVKCKLKTIIKSYRHCCDPCGKLHKICTKCLQQKAIKQVEQEEKKGVDKALLKKMEEYLKTMRERSKRKIMRLVQQRLITFNTSKDIFEYIEDGKPVDSLQFKGLDDDDDLFGSDNDLDDDDDEEDDAEDKENDDNEEEKVAENGENNIHPQTEEQQSQSQNQNAIIDILSKQKNFNTKGVITVHKQKRKQQLKERAEQQELEQQQQNDNSDDDKEIIQQKQQDNNNKSANEDELKMQELIKQEQQKEREQEEEQQKNSQN